VPINQALYPEKFFDKSWMRYTCYEVLEFLMVETRRNSQHRKRRQHGRCNFEMLNSQWNRWIRKRKWTESDKTKLNKWLKTTKFAQQTFLFHLTDKKFRVGIEVRGSFGRPETDLFWHLISTCSVRFLLTIWILWTFSQINGVRCYENNNTFISW